jgi:ABC-type branched-subunit amino acid transport system ATPase component
MFNEEQSRVLQWRMSSGDVAALIGPPGSGKTTTGAMQNIAFSGIHRQFMYKDRQCSSSRSPVTNSF